ncbi:MAG: hypothetical protein ACJAUP_003880 [Cellvibrionaceae bacterium]|jgi:hypothetical protein
MSGSVIEWHVIVFINRKRTLIKALYYSNEGGKRLEQGCFHPVIFEDKYLHKMGLN